MSQPMEEPECTTTAECPDATQDSPAPDDFLQPYVTEELRDLFSRRSAGDEGADEETDEAIKRIMKAESEPLAGYLKQENENVALEGYRKRYHRMQALSWVSLVLCAVITVAVLVCLFVKPELLWNRMRDAVICGAAVLFSVLTWTFSSISGHCVKRMVEIELALRVLKLPEKAAAEEPEELSSTDAEQDLPEESADSAEEDGALPVEAGTEQSACE